MPVAIPLFATSPGAGAVVEPVAGTRQAGFATDDYPPAQWFNWLFAQNGECADFALGGGANSFAFFETPRLKVIRVDTDTAESGSTIHRLLGVGHNAANLYSSKRGQSWRELALNATSPFGTPLIAAWSGALWVVGTNEGNIWTTVGDTVSGSAITDDTLNWTATTDAGTHSGLPVNVIGVGESTNIVATRLTTIMYSTNGSSFTDATISGTAPTASFTDILWTGAAWLAINSNGQIYSATTASGVWTHFASDLPSGVAWRLATDGTIVIAMHDTGGQNWYQSDNVGTTWTLHTPPAFVGSLSRIHFYDGAWFVVMGGAPGLAMANDPASTSWVRVTLPAFEDDETGTFEDLALAEGALLLTMSAASTHAGVFVSARAADLAPGPWVPPGTPARLHDAAYLQGVLVDPTTPTDGEDLTYNGTLHEWEVGNRYVSTATDYSAVAGDRTVGITDTSAVRTIITPPSPKLGQRFTVKDVSGNGGTHHPVVQGNGENIDGGATTSITVNYGAVTLFYNGTTWSIESRI